MSDAGWSPERARRLEVFFGMPETSGLTPEQWYEALRAHLNTLTDLNEQFLDQKPGECVRGPHRPPQGPNEDLAQCFRCGSIDHALRPEGETFGHHLADCSLPERHEGYCEPGGAGHPPAKNVRGYWP